jgi:hypothetical protein
LLRLVANRPGISRAKCALALEARNDSDEEIDRITELSDKSESAIRREIGITESNWDNAKKILPRFAEQLGDVQKSGQSFHLSDIPGGGEDGDGRDGPADPNPLSTPPTPPAGRATTRTPRRSSAVTAGTIARTATTDSWDEANAIEQVELDPERQRSSKEKLMDRLRRHNLIVQNIASLMEQHGAELFENPFDCLACFPSEGLMWEVKSLDGTESDEIVRVREALAQLLYYEAFVTTPNVKYRLAKKIACFERKISDAHIKWLEDKGILVVWVDGDTLQGSERAMAELSAYLVA